MPLAKIHKQNCKFPRKFSHFFRVFFRARDLRGRLFKLIWYLIFFPVILYPTFLNSFIFLSICQNSHFFFHNLLFLSLSLYPVQFLAHIHTSSSRHKRSALSSRTRLVLFFFEISLRRIRFSPTLLSAPRCPHQESVSGVCLKDNMHVHLSICKTFSARDSRLPMTEPKCGRGDMKMKRYLCHRIDFFRGRNCEALKKRVFTSVGVYIKQILESTNLFGNFLF